MSKICIIGDTHGEFTLRKLKNAIKKNPDYIIVAGDFGYLFDNSKYENDLLDKINRLGCKILWICGNHENFYLINQYPDVDMFDGKVKIIRDNIIYLNRGYVYNIEGSKFFCFGGAKSVDRYSRVENYNWWRDEIASKEIEELGVKNLELNNFEVDYIITHTCSNTTLSQMINYPEVDITSNYLEFIRNNTKFKKWFFGHLHLDKNVNNEYCLYNTIETICI